MISELRSRSGRRRWRGPRPATPGRRQRPTSRVSWADLDVLCLTAMHKDPERRYRTVEALIRDVDHYLDGEPLDARPDSVSYRLGKFVRRNTRGVAAAALALVALVEHRGLLHGAPRHARATRPSPRPPAPSGSRASCSTSSRAATRRQARPRACASSRWSIAACRRRAASVGEPAVQAELLATLGGIYQQLGNLDRADSLLSAALEQSHRAARAGSPRCGRERRRPRAAAVRPGDVRRRRAAGAAGT